MKENIDKIKAAIKMKDDVRYNTKIANDAVSELSEGDGWRQFDSFLDEFGATFVKSLPKEYVEYMEKKIFVDTLEKGQVFKKYIEDTLSKSKEGHNLSAVELGGPGINFFDGFSKDFFTKTLGVCINDDFRLMGRVRHLNSKKEQKHFVLLGDIVDISNDQLYKKIEETIGTKKIDLIVSRMMGALTNIKKNPFIFNHLIRKWYNMLNNDGLMFVQFEYFIKHNPNPEQQYEGEISSGYKYFRDSEIFVEKWVNIIKEKFPEIDIQLDRGIMRLHKNPGAPEELPSASKLFSQ